jgi:hypothetical protein
MTIFQELLQLKLHFELSELMLLITNHQLLHLLTYLDTGVLNS